MVWLRLKYLDDTIARSWSGGDDWEAFKNVMQSYVTRQYDALHMHQFTEVQSERLRKKRDEYREVYLILTQKHPNNNFIQAFNNLKSGYTVTMETTSNDGDTFAPFMKKIEELDREATTAEKLFQAKLEEDLRKAREENLRLRVELKRLKSCDSDCECDCHE